MERSLRPVLAGREVARISDYRELGLEAEEYSDEKVFGVLDSFAERLGGDIVLYGGITATERIYGYKRIRDVTTDLDFVATEAGVSKLLEKGGVRGPSRLSRRGERLYYHEGFDILFAVADNLPVSFALGHIHDWPVDDDFFAAARIVRPGATEVRCASREHCVMLKWRRGDRLVLDGGKPFGKDALDILNIFAGAACRDGPGSIDLDFLDRILRSAVTDDAARLLAFLEFVERHRRHLSQGELACVDPIIDALRDTIARDS